MLTACGVHLCQRCADKRSVALGEGPAPNRLAEAAVSYQIGSYLPDLRSEIADPFQTLRYFYDQHEQRIRERLEKRVTDARHSEQVALGESGGGGTGGKKLSLRRKAKKSGAQSADEAFALKQLESLSVVRAEVAAMVKRLEVAHDAFVDAVCELVDIRDTRQQREITVFSAYAMLDTSVVAHPLLAELKLCDNKYFVEVGRALLQAHVYAYSLAQGRPIEVAIRRFKQITEDADVWLTKRFRSVARTMMPVMWRLRADTHEHITDDELKYVERRVMRGTPLIIIGLLHILRLRDERDKVIKELIVHFF
jgi:hypothetical protein